MSRLLPVLVFVLSSCDLTMTLDPVVYEGLDQQQRSAADRIFARLQAYDARLRAVSAGSYGLGPIAEDRDRIDVAIEGKWILLNLGDDRIHITTWEGLTAVQRERWARHYDKYYYGDHVRELTDPDDPAGHIWFLCMHLEAAEARRIEFTSSFAAELDVLVRQRAGEE